MPPDLNSLPTSRSPSNAGSPLQLRPRRASSNIGPANDLFQHNPPSPHSPVMSSLHAAAAINASRQRSPSTSRAAVNQERRRSGLPDLDPSITTPGEAQRTSYLNESAVSDATNPMAMADLHHQRQRAPSLGQLHQQLESEQEAQVNRLLQLIRVQQDQIASLQTQTPTVPAPEPNNPTPSTAESPALHRDIPPLQTTVPSLPAAAPHTHPRSPMQRPSSLSRQSSRSISVTAGLGSNASSPSLRPLSSGYAQNEEWLAGGTRDESTFYQAETQTLTRENQMLKMRIRELERQVNELNSTTTAPSASTEQDAG